MRYPNKQTRQKLLSYIAYPKLSILLCTYILALLLFYGKNYAPFNAFLISFKYIGTFVAGFFYAYSFTTALATSTLLILSRTQNIYIACLCAAIGASLSDVVIFSFVKHTFKEEIHRLFNKKIIHVTIEHIPKPLLRNFLISFGCFLIAAPLPTEIGVSLLASAVQISSKKFVILAYLLNTVGIFIILLAGKSVR